MLSRLELIHCAKLLGDAQEREAALKELEGASMDLGKTVYEAAQAKGGQGAGDAAGAPEASSAGKSGGKDEVIDAEYEVKEDR